MIYRLPDDTYINTKMIRSFKADTNYLRITWYDQSYTNCYCDNPSQEAKKLASIMHASPDIPLTSFDPWED